MSVSTREVLTAAGFEVDWSASWAEAQPGYIYRVGRFEVRAAELTSFPSFRRVLSLSPMGYDGRRLFWDSDAEMPLDVRSVDQGFAWLADLFQRWDLKPDPIPGWFEQGVKSKHLLPWVERQARYGARPQCDVERDWLKVATRRLRAAVAMAHDAVVTLSFDGTILRVTLDSDILPMPAKGSGWPTTYVVRLSDFCWAFNRIMQPMVNISVWEGHLHAGKRRIALVEFDSSN